MSIDNPDRRLTLRSAVPVWFLVTIGALLIGLFAPVGQYLTWLPIVLAASILITFCVQLAIVQKEGLVNRIMTSLGGSVVILAVATLVLGALQLSTA